MKHKIETSIKNTEKPKYYIWVEKRKLHFRKVDMYLGIKSQLPGDISTNNKKNTKKVVARIHTGAALNWPLSNHPLNKQTKFKNQTKQKTESKLGL